MEDSDGDRVKQYNHKKSAGPTGPAQFSVMYINA